MSNCDSAASDKRNIRNLGELIGISSKPREEPGTVTMFAPGWHKLLKIYQKRKEKEKRKRDSVTLFMHYKMNILPKLHLCTLITFCTAMSLTSPTWMSTVFIAVIPSTFYASIFAWWGFLAASHISFGHIPLLHLAGLSWSDFLL